MDSQSKERASRRDAFNEFLKILEITPNAVAPGIGGEKLAEEIIKGAEKLKEFLEAADPP